MFAATAAVLLLAASLTHESLRWEDLSLAFRSQVAAGPHEFSRLLRGLEAQAEDRLRRGEREHLIYYILQSRSFTDRPPLEPALLARTSDLPTAEASERIADFLRALRLRSTDERLEWWRQHLPGDQRNLPALRSAYSEAMRFLREKEFGGTGAAVYRTRGHSSDTSLAASYSVWNALTIVRALDRGAELHRVLIIGPGLDFAPRTGFRDDVPPQSYQPILTARSLLDLNLSSVNKLQITCVDINPRVLDFVVRRRTLVLPEETGNPDFRAYLNGLGRTTGMPEPLFRRMQARRLNIITERLKGSKFDLIIATNLLLYFDDRELAMALTNVAAMLRAGGYFVHNETRPFLEEAARGLGMPAVQGRVIEIAKGTKAPLLDAIVIHRRE